MHERKHRLLFSSELELRAAFGDAPRQGVITGVGPIESAMRVAAIPAEDEAPLLFIGTCGAYPASRLAIGDIVVGNSVRLLSGDVARGEMRLPGLVPRLLELDRALAEELASAHELRRVETIGCTLGVTEDETLARLLGADAEVENLEAYGVALGAGSRRCAIVLGVTNIVGPGGGADWKRHHTRVLAEMVERLELL